MVQRDNVMTTKRSGMSCLLYCIRGIYILNALLNYKTDSTSIHRQKIYYEYFENTVNPLYSTWLEKMKEHSSLRCSVITIDNLQNNLSAEKPLKRH